MVFGSFDSLTEDQNVVRAGEIEHGVLIADRAEEVWNWSTPAGRSRAVRRGELILRTARITPNQRVLELGCGTGLFTEMFARTGCRLDAVDISKPLLDRAFARNLGDRVVFQLADAEELPFPDGTFDAVIGSSILHHLCLDPALVEIHRVLAPGARMVFAEPNMLNPQIALQRHVPAIRRWAGESPEETAFVRWSLSQRMRLAGFQLVRVAPFDFLHPVVPVRWIQVVRKVGASLEQIPVVREVAGSLLIQGSKKAV